MLLSVRDLVVRFRTHDGTVNAVNGVSFDLEEGETLGLVGESGCGKSVTNLAIMHLLPQPAGRIEGGQVLFEGVDLTTLSESDIRLIRGSEIAMIFQDPMTSLNPVLTIEEQLVETIRAHRKVSPADARTRAIELLGMVGIPEPASRLKSYPHQFSGGMRQRVMIAMALALEPKLLIADEPTTALDVTIQAQMLELLQRLTSGAGHRRHPDHPRPGGRGRDDPPDQRDVRRLRGRGGHDGGPVRCAAAPVHGRPAALDPAPRCGGGRAAHPDRRRTARPAGGARRLRRSPRAAPGGWPAAGPTPRRSVRSSRARPSRRRGPRRPIGSPAGIPRPRRKLSPGRRSGPDSCRPRPPDGKVDVVDEPGLPAAAAPAGLSHEDRQ